jgi:hypothetical protein
MYTQMHTFKHTHMTPVRITLRYIILVTLTLTITVTFSNNQQHWALITVLKHLPLMTTDY